MLLDLKLDESPEDREIRKILKIILEEFADVVAISTQEYKRKARILSILRLNDRPEFAIDAKEPKAMTLLVLVNHPLLTNRKEYWSHVENELSRAYEITEEISRRVNLIVHTFAEVNGQLSRGSRFYVEAIRDGIVLIDARGPGFERPLPLSEGDRIKQIEDDFAFWHSSARAFIEMARGAMSADSLREASFSLHQAAERLYHCAISILKGHSPRTHQLTMLRSLAESADWRLSEVWPSSTKEERRAFELLRRAYVDARYSRNFKINSEEVAYMSARIDLLEGLVAQIFSDEIRRH